ncbi:MAG: B12-binding domain-containing radical SAM protein [Anaerolineae bacterium]
MKLTRSWVMNLKQIEPFLPFANPTFGNLDFEEASYHVLIVRLSPLRDVDRSIPHLFLFQEVRRALRGAFIDMAFLPSAGERALFEQEGIPFLIGTQSLRSADEFDLLLISNAYTLELINLPYLLIHSGFPLFASQRGPEWPIIILGGSNAMAAQSIIREDGDSLVDGIFFGEGEGLVGDLVRLLRVGESASQRGGETARRELLERAAQQILGLWIAGSLHPTQKAVLHRPEARLLPVEYPLLNSPEAHTSNLQINYGCPAFCSFCFEGYDRKPYRELPLDDVLSAARQIKQAQGVEELNLYSFNFNTHQDILEMILELHRLFDRVSFKSQRLDVLQHTETLLEAEVEADKREFTLGIEGISQRQRAWLHKSLSTEDITALLDRLFALKIRRVKLFYVLTGYEINEDIEEFRQFLKWLKEARRSWNRHTRVVFSFGLLIRMPFTPLRYDRLFLDEQAWWPLIGQVKSACETNGFEFRLAFDWPAYAVSQVLALGGYWLVEPIVALARKGYCFDATLPPEYWDELKGWMERTGRWSEEFLGEKGPDYPFALEFVESNVPAEFLYRQYREARSRVDGDYCLGAGGQPGRCLGCGACVDEEQRRAITRHRIRQPERGPYLAQLREVVARKRRLQPAYFLLRLDPWLAGVLPEFLNGLVFKELLARYPELVDNLLAVRESLFTLHPNDRRFPSVSGEAVFGLKAWDVEALRRTLADPRGRVGLDFEIVGPAERFTPGAFTRLHLDVHLPGDLFPEPRVRLEQYLRGAYLPYSLRREDSGYRFDLARKALKKKILFDGSFETREEGFFASLDVGPKFDLLAFLQTFGEKHLSRHAQVRVSMIQW